MSNNGIFCMEGNWCDERDTTISVLPMLEILFKSSHVSFAHHYIKSSFEFEKNIRNWKKYHRHDYPILYLAFHGQKNSVCIGSTFYSLSDLCALLGNTCHNSIIMFASCKTLQVPENSLRQFFSSTGAWALFGYDRMVTWMNAAACEFLTLSSLQSISFSGRGMSIIKNRLNSYDGLYKTLGFHFFTSNDFV